MRIVVTADLHYDSARSRRGAAALARQAVETGGDALVLVGDAASAEHGPLRECLGLFEAFPGRKFFVLGNHCLWCLPGEDSIDRYERIVPAIAAEMGFETLDHAPARLGETGLAGSIGWYDYSYRHEDLGIPLEFYRAKVAPGAAERFPEHRHLVERFRGQLADWHLNLTARWMDGTRVRMDMTDEQFLEYLLGRLGGHLDELASDGGVTRVLAFVHHLPVRDLLPRDRPAPLAFAAAFLGSDRIGEVLMGCPKLTHVFCGHSHWPGRCRVGGVEVINLGCTYEEKRLEVLEV